MLHGAQASAVRRRVWYDRTLPMLHGARQSAGALHGNRQVRTPALIALRRVFPLSRERVWRGGNLRRCCDCRHRAERKRKLLVWLNGKTGSDHRNGNRIRRNSFGFCRVGLAGAIGTQAADAVSSIAGDVLRRNRRRLFLRRCAFSLHRCEQYAASALASGVSLRCNVDRASRFDHTRSCAVTKANEETAFTSTLAGA